jgi:hypothetical protein
MIKNRPRSIWALKILNMPHTGEELFQQRKVGG